MPQLIEDVVRVRDFLREKQHNEQRLIANLLHSFNHNAQLIGPMRKMAFAAIAELEQLRTKGYNGLKLFNTQWASASRYDVVRHYKTWRQIEALSRRANPTAPSAEHCADIIRLYGAVVSAASKDPTFRDSYGPLHNQKMAYAKDWAHAKDPNQPGPPGGQSLIWNTKKGGGRLRERVDTSKPHPLTMDLGFGQGALNLRGGISRWTTPEASTVHKIDRMFGLLIGADISGTTIDNLFFLDRFGGARLDPIYYLVPLVTLVGGGHHSLLEVALSLSINHQTTGIQYSVGSYTTLMPDSSHVAANAVRALMTAHESNSANRHLLIFYIGPQRPAGCYLFAKSGHEHMAFRLLASADDNLLQTFRHRNTWPTQDDVRQHKRLYGL